jgi:PAS domain S-box-containing protein
LNGEVLAANPALVTLFGYDSAEAMTDAGVMNSYVDAEDRERWRDLLETKGSVEGFEMRLRRHDGGEIWVRESARAVRDPSGAVEYYEGMIEDVTQRKSLEEQFRQAQKMEGVGQLAGGIAHDFNNLLTVISSYADMLAQSFPEGDERVEDATAISNAAARSAELTRQLLAFSRQQVLQPRVLDLNEVIADVQKILGRLLREDIEIATVFAPTLGAILADPGQVEQVIVNLAVNARDAMPKGGTLTITTANVELDATYADAQRTMEPGLYTVLTMTDTGIGMEADVRRRIFEPFYTTKELGKGTGLGLATVYGIVKQSNGYVWVDSEPGRGATFTVYLPQVQGGAEPIAPSSATATAAVGGHETILLVEDEEGVRKLTLKVLQRLGYTVLTATNGEEALNVLEQRGASIDLVITDVIMPKLAGHDLAERLSQRYPRCRVLFMSGYAPDAIGRHRVLDKRTAFLPKPFSPTGLGQKVREVLDAARIVD